MDESDRRVAALVALFTSPTTLCVVPVTYMADFMDKFAKFACRTIPMLHETKTLYAGEFAILCPTCAACRISK